MAKTHKLRRWREGQKLSLKKAADMVGISDMAWFRYEHGQVPRAQIIADIVKATGGAVRFEDFVS